MIDFEKLKNDVGELNEDAAMETLNILMSEGGDAQKGMEACQNGLEIVGERFQQGEYFVADLIFAGEIMQGAVAILKPALVSASDQIAGKMVFCTVQGDMHDIGKNIVRSLLEAGGMEVIDLGVDVPAQKIVDCLKANDAKILALSGVLTLAVNSMKDTVDALKDAGIRDNVRVIIGGAPVTADACDIVGADAWTLNPQEALKICLNWAEKSA